MSDTIDFMLTSNQHEALLPLLKQISAAAKAGKKGMIIGQFGAFTGRVGFVPYEYAKRISEIIKEMEENANTNTNSNR